jgi:sodium transport system permease protein
MIFKIFKKELKDSLRDRRTLMSMLVIPIILFPVIINLIIFITNELSDEVASKELKIGMVGDANNKIYNELKALPDELGKKQIVFFKDTIAMIEAVKIDSIQLGTFIPKNIQNSLDSLSSVPLVVYHNGADVGMMERAEVYMNTIDQKAKSERLAKLNIDETKITPFITSYRNVASDKEMFGKLAGGMLPYIFIIFGFIGCMYPAIDLFTGEKERGTIETLLTTPVSRWQILFGKMGVVVLSGITAATCSLLGLYLTIQTMDLGPNVEIMEVVNSILSFEFVVLLYALLIPLTIFFAGILIPITIYAKSFKEAQSIIAPLNILIILPAMVALTPGIELSFMTACIPIVNIALATKELIAGTLDYGLVAISFSVMVVFAFIAVMVSYRRFGKENSVIN